MASALYRNREGEVWPLGDVRPHPTFRSMVTATRLDTGETITVLAREVRPAAPAAEENAAEISRK